jgi:hypothetical protein
MQAGARPWDASVRVFFGHNDNVQLVPDATVFNPNGERESAYLGVSLDAAYRFIQTTEWTAGAAMTADRLVYDKGGVRTLTYDPPDWYNLTALQPTLFARRHFQLADMPASAGITYGYRQERLKVHAGGLQSHTVRLDAALATLPNLTFDASYTYGNDNIDVPFTGTKIRDAERDVVGLGAVYAWNQGLRKVKVSYSHTDNDADGIDWDYTGNAFKARFETRLTGPFWLGLEASRDKRDYNGGWGRTEQEIIRFGAQVLWILDTHWVADVYCDTDRYDANAPAFETDQTQYGAGITYRF